MVHKFSQLRFAFSPSAARKKLRVQLGWEFVCTRLCPRLAWITFDAFAIVDVGKNRIGIWNVFPWMTKWIWHRIKEEDTSQPAEGKKRIGKIGKGGKIGQRQTLNKSTEWKCDIGRAAGHIWMLGAKLLPWPWDCARSSDCCCLHVWTIPFNQLYHPTTYY